MSNRVPTKLLTLMLVFKNESKQVLLGMKKRGFGANKYNGFGGKVEKGETILEGANRELKEEAGIVAHNITQVLFRARGMRRGTTKNPQQTRN